MRSKTGKYLAMNDPQLTLVTGGCRSGKSRYALDQADKFDHPVFIATAESTDEEMRSRIEHHQAERGEKFYTIERPYNPASAFTDLPSETDVVILDCVTVWIGNLLNCYGEQADNAGEIENLLQTITSIPLACRCIVVTNETGLGVVPMNAMARQFRDLAGSVNQRLAQAADSVVMTVCGIPVTIK